jgi:gamma-glutamyltranspeptidase/glutathione hydrolase
LTPSELGVIAAGHPETARAGAEVLRRGGNAVDGALGAMLASFACEPLLTGLGAGGYMLVAAPAQDPVLLDFFVEAPGRGIDPSSRAELRPITVSFGDAIQVFNIGAASVGTYGIPAGIAEACIRFGRMPLSELVAPAARLARDGVALTRQQAYVFAILKDIVTATPECAALFAPEGRVPDEGELVRQPELADTLELLAARGAAPFYTGEIAQATVSWIGSHGGTLTAGDLERYAVVSREPVHTSYRGRTVVTNPPPSAGWTRSPGHPTPTRSLRRWSGPSRSAPPSSSKGSPTQSSCAGSCSVCARSAAPHRLRKPEKQRNGPRLVRRLTSRCSTATAGPAR